MKTSAEIREKLEWYKKALEGCECMDDEWFEYKHIVQLLMWILGDIDLSPDKTAI